MHRLFFALFLLSSVAVAQTKLNNLPAASTPLTGSELTYVLQGGVDNKTAVSTLWQTNIPLSQLASEPNGTVVGNCSGGAATPQACATLPTAAIPVFSGDCSSVGGSATLTCNTLGGHTSPYLLAQWGVPVILSSGTISTTPSASGGYTPSTTFTANPCVNGCYIYVMANAITGSNAAAPYYATCSSTSNCSLFNNALATGSLPTIVGSPTSFGTVAGGTSTITTATDFVLVSVSLPANSLGTNGALSITGMEWRNSNTNSISEKIWVGATAGTLTNTLATMSAASATFYGTCRTFRLMGVANALAAFPGTTNNSVCDNTNVNQTPSIFTNNFANQQYITFTGQLVTASTDYLQVIGHTMTVSYAP